MRGRLLAAIVLIAAAAPALKAAPAGFIAPTKKDKCPVCGMFVARYPEWIAEVVFADGTYAVFDGAKDLFRFTADAARFLPAAKGKQVGAIFVMDYYSLEPIDGAAAFYVLGSDVLGPMGRELIPFQKRPDAESFLADHKGTRVVGLEEVPAVLPGLLE